MIRILFGTHGPDPAITLAVGPSFRLRFLDSHNRRGRFILALFARACPERSRRGGTRCGRRRGIRHAPGRKVGSHARGTAGETLRFIWHGINQNFSRRDQCAFPTFAKCVREGWGHSDLRYFEREQSWAPAGIRLTCERITTVIDRGSGTRAPSIPIFSPSHQLLEYLYGLTGGFSRSQCSTHFTVLISTSAFLCPEKLMSGTMNSVCGPLATLKEQLKLIDCTPRSLHPV
jgi:hypothetical protein